MISYYLYDIFFGNLSWLRFYHTMVCHNEGLSISNWRNWKLRDSNGECKVYPYINKTGEIIYYRNHNNKLIPECYLSLSLQFNTLFREIKLNSSGIVYIGNEINWTWISSFVGSNNHTLEWDLICINLFFRKTMSVCHQERWKGKSMLII